MKRFWILVMMTLLSAGAWSKDNGEWRATMNRLSKALSEVVPYLFPDPNLNQKELAEKMQALAALTRDLDLKSTHSMKAPDNDPALPYMASQFRQEIERANESLQEGHADYAKSVIRSSVSYCITCHTRHEAGTQFPLLTAFEKPLQRASWIERMEFSTASRQYDTVIKEVMDRLKASGTPTISTLDLERGARIALALQVRIKKSPEQAMNLARALGASPSANVSMKETSRIWMKDIKDWQKEMGRKFTGADEILKEARQLVQSNVGDHAEVRFLRATTLLHDLFQLKAQDAEVAEAAYLIGSAYSRLDEIGMWNLHEFYYMACIDKAPHSALAMKCYQSYEDTVTLGYSGSGGIHVPRSIREHMNRLKDKALPDKK